MIGTRFYKGNYDADEYSNAAQWCNENGCSIEDMGEYYEVVEIIIPINELRQQKIQELKFIRDTKELEPIYCDGEYFDFDEKSYSRITAAIYTLEQMGEGATIMWTTARNTAKEVTTQTLRSIIAAAGVRSNQLHSKYRELKERVQVAPDKYELDKIVWE